MLGIEQLLSKRTFEISGGQAQRTAVARAVVTNPSLLLADEPTGNLDSKATKDVMELFQMLNETQNATILMVTHDSFVASYCKRVLIIKDGQLYRNVNSDKLRELLGGTKSSEKTQTVWDRLRKGRKRHEK